MVLEILLIQMDLCTKETGWMVKNMVKEHSILKVVYIEKGNGKMEKESNGHLHTKLNDNRYLIIYFNNTSIMQTPYL